jgi:protein ImuB
MPDGRPLVVPEGGARAALAPLPVAALRLPVEIVHDLNRLGLRRVGELYGLPRAPLAPRFGESVARRLDQALGLVREPISPRRPPEPRTERLGFVEPILAAEDLRRGTRLMMERLCRRLERQALGIRRLELACYRVDCRVERAAIGTSRPSRDPSHLLRLIAEKLERIAPGLGIEAMLLQAIEVEALAPDQPGLGRAGVAAPPLDASASLVDRLVNRLGAANVRRLVPFESHLPERAVRSLPALAEAPAAGTWPHGPPRPIRLLERPDPVEAVAPVPDDPPLLFRWRGATYRVRRAEGPERIAAEWWRDPAAAGDGGVRDYYRVEDEAGRRFWLYRQGLYRPELPPRWFLHGFFP